MEPTKPRPPAWATALGVLMLVAIFGPALYVWWTFALGWCE
jgi:hypothetical protein